ncbi:hypothetical protein Emag_004087 [Eimeria magna]
MPGIYSKPPRRGEFAADMRCLVEAADASFKAGEEWTSYVSMIIDELEKERAKARQEVSEEEKTQKEVEKANDSEERKRKSHQQLVARKEIEVAEVFFECGVHTFFCNAVEQADPSVHPAVLEQILRVYEVYQLIEVDPFDDDMGVVSLLNFFLSERHSYYIDIHWRENELSHMQAFISSFLKLASFRVGLSEAFSCISTQSTASESSLPDTSPHKAIQSKTHLSDEAARLLHVCLWTFPPHRVEAEALQRSTPWPPLPSLASVPHSPEKLSEPRSLGRAARSPVAMRGGLIMPAGVHALDFATPLVFLHETDHSQQNSRITYKCMIKQNKASTMEALHARNRASSGAGFLGGPGGPLTLLRVVLHLLLKTNAPERQRLMQLGEPQLAHIASCLCSRLAQLSPTAGSATAAEEHTHALNQEQGCPEASSPVPVNDASLDPKEEALTFCLILLGLAQLLFDHEAAREVPSTPAASEEGGRIQRQKAGVSAETVAQTARGCQALADIYEYLHPRFAHLKEEAHAAAEEEVHDAASMRTPPAEVIGQAGFDPREFFLGIVGIMALLMGSLSLQGVEQLRWRFVENPLATVLPASAGGLASTARSMLAHYKKTQEEGCEIVKKLTSLVVLRSEQAAGMVLRSRASS